MRITQFGELPNQSDARVTAGNVGIRRHATELA
jgi:hypothetical protein